VRSKRPSTLARRDSRRQYRLPRCSVYSIRGTGTTRTGGIERTTGPAGGSGGKWAAGISRRGSEVHGNNDLMDISFSTVLRSDRVLFDRCCTLSSYLLRSSKEMRVYFWFYLLVVCLIALIVLTWYISFSVTSVGTDRVSYLLNNNVPEMSAYFGLITLIVMLSIIIFIMRTNVNLREPFTHPGVFLFSTTVLLLSIFYIRPEQQSPPEGDNRHKHPLIFFTAAFFLIMCVLASINASINRSRFVNFKPF
jgi:hypothetical protein